jgi:hypothetical protein
MTKYETITTHDIRQGDIIWSNGMRLLIDSEPQVSKAHPVTDYGGECIWVKALITNWDEIVADADEFPGGVSSMVRSFVRDDMAPNGHAARNGRRLTEPRWTIQGNGLADWAREVQE